VPTVSRVAVLWDSSGIHEGLSLENQKVVARKLGMMLLPFDAKTLEELNAALVAVARERANELFVFPNFINGKHAQLILDFAATNRLPTMFQETWWLEHGGLMSYYTNWLALRRRAAVFVDKILKGAKPGDLPVEQPTKFDLVINLKTAKALGLTIPQSVLARTDEVIQ
jgi:putative ABC transport system substrate-binding protein